MLKWTAAEGERGLSRTKVPGPPGSVPAMPADLIACLKANPEACAEVMRGLDENYDRSIGVVVRRAESAERERDALRELIHEESGLDDHHPDYSPELIRVSAEQLARWRQAASAAAVSLSEWVRTRLDAEG